MLRVMSCALTVLVLLEFLYSLFAFHLDSVELIRPYLEGMFDFLCRFLIQLFWTGCRGSTMMPASDRSGNGGINGGIFLRLRLLLQLCLLVSHLFTDANDGSRQRQQSDQLNGGLRRIACIPRQTSRLLAEGATHTTDTQSKQSQEKGE